MFRLTWEFEVEYNSFNCISRDSSRWFWLFPMEASLSL
jgi:hypothetical protein